MKILPVGVVLFYADRRTDRRTDIRTHITKLIVVFRNSDHTMDLELTQPLTEFSTRNLSWG